MAAHRAGVDRRAIGFKTTAPHQLWQTAFTYLEAIGWGWFYLSTILDDFSRYIIAGKLRTTRSAQFSRTRCSVAARRSRSRMQ